MRRIADYLELVKFQHTLFALPFALTSALIAARGIPRAGQLGWILLAMVGARTAAMGFNRIADCELDRLNPRTRDREIPAGRITVAKAAILVAVASAAFVFAAWRLNHLAFVLSAPTLGVLFVYSFTKRFTSLSHLVLGFCLGIAPIGAWVAVRGAIDLPPVLLGAGVMFWVAGFDILYATLDREFDDRAGLHSFVLSFGIEGALWWARVFHFFFVAFLVAFSQAARLGAPFYLGAACIALFLLYEHSLVRPTDLRRVNVAFFTVNGAVSIAVFVAASLDLVLRSN